VHCSGELSPRKADHRVSEVSPPELSTFQTMNQIFEQGTKLGINTVIDTVSNKGKNIVELPKTGVVVNKSAIERKSWIMFLTKPMI
jgi:hypothetical protein